MRAYLSPFTILILYEKLNELILKDRRLCEYKIFRTDSKILKLLNRYNIPNSYYFFIWQDLKKCTRDNFIMSFHNRIEDNSNSYTTFTELPAEIDNPLWTEFRKKLEKKYSFNTFSLEKKDNIYIFQSGISKNIKNQFHGKVPYHSK